MKCEMLFAYVCVRHSLSMAQEQTLESLTKQASSLSSLSLPICHGKQLIKLKPPPVAQAETEVRRNMMMTHPPYCHQVFIQECKHLNYSLKMMIYISI